MQIYLTNLDRHVDRLAFVVKQLNGLGLPFKRMAGIDVSEFSEMDLASYETARPSKELPFTKGKVGCWLSHKQIWKMFAETDDRYCLIIEDDVHLSADLTRFLADTRWIPEDADIVRLEDPGNLVKLASSKECNDRALARVVSTSEGTAAYILTRNGLKKIAHRGPVSNYSVDRFLFSRETTLSCAADLIVYQVVKALAIQDRIANPKVQQGFDSNITTEVQTLPIWKAAWLRLRLGARRLKKQAIGFRYVGFE